MKQFLYKNILENYWNENTAVVLCKSMGPNQFLGALFGRQIEVQIFAIDGFKAKLF